jgi:hypothetical protein
MATSTAPVRHTDIVAVIGAVQAAGGTLTVEAVYREVRRRQMPCRRSTVQAAVRAWHQAQAAADVAPSSVAPASPGLPPVPQLRARRRLIVQLETDARALEEAVRLNQQQLAACRAAERRDLLELPRLVRDNRQAQQAAGSPAYLMQPEMETEGFNGPAMGRNLTRIRGPRRLGSRAARTAIWLTRCAAQGRNWP